MSITIAVNHRGCGRWVQLSLNLVQSKLREQD